MTESASRIGTAYREVLERVDSARARSSAMSAVTLVAVSKERTINDIAALYAEGHRDFGENRAQDLASKAPSLPADIRWHYVGALQTNKTRLVRPMTSLLHSMDRPTLATAWVKGPGLPPPALVQVNLGAEPQKSGVATDELDRSVEHFVELGLEIKGLMAIPPMEGTAEGSRRHFRLLASLRDRIADRFPTMTELSMGMTDDFEVAIEEGASIIRVGRAIFGPRT